MNESVLQAGRPHGGVIHRRVCGITLVFNNKCMFVFNVYMSCDVKTNYDLYEFNTILSDISMYCIFNNVDYCIIGGDINTDLSRVKSSHTISII